MKKEQKTKDLTGKERAELYGHFWDKNQEFMLEGWGRVSIMKESDTLDQNTMGRLTKDIREGYTTNIESSDFVGNKPQGTVQDLIDAHILVSDREFLMYQHPIYKSQKFH